MESINNNLKNLRISGNGNNNSNDSKNLCICICGCGVIEKYCNRRSSFNKIESGISNSSHTDEGDDNFLEFYQPSDILKEQKNKTPRVLVIYNYFMMPNIDFSNITKLILGCTSNIESFDNYFNVMPKLEYFCYVFFNHGYEALKIQEQLKASAWDINDNYTIKHFEVTVSEHDIGRYEIINNDASACFISRLKCLQSLRIEVQIFNQISKQLIANKTCIPDLYIFWDYYFVINYPSTPTSYYYCGTTADFLLEAYEKKVYTNVYIQAPSSNITHLSMDSIRRCIPGIVFPILMERPHWTGIMPKRSRKFFNMDINDFNLRYKWIGYTTIKNK